MVGKGKQQRFVGIQVLEHAGEEARLCGGAPNLAWLEAAEGEKAPKPLGLGCEVAKRLNRQRFCGLAVERIASLHGIAFGFP
jgi:hypothetical protein